jgi:hypothetical protein
MIQGKNIDKELLTANNITVFDLSAGPAVEMAFIHPTKDAIINNVYVVWVEASSADAGIALEIGSTSGGAEYFTATSSVSQSAATTQTYSSGSLVLGTIPKGTAVFIGHAGGKAGTGTCYLCFSYTLR